MHPGESLDEQISNFLNSKQKFQLGELLTEQGHPMTENLSELAENNVVKGIQTLMSVDREALEKTRNQYFDHIDCLHEEVSKCIDRGGRVFLGGCGATGRLSICLERLWRETHQSSSHEDSVVSFMAGGDVAFVHAIEGFEDYPEYGARQLEELGFTSKDLFIGITEGGETPFVIGATKRASEISDSNAFFLFSNPTELLIQRVARSKAIVEDPKVTPLDFHTGPMALAGSTRMQSSTILMMVVGLALFSLGELKPKHWIKQAMDGLLQSLEGLPLEALAQFCKWEAEVYRSGNTTLYNCDEYSVSVFTDTTERAPTFSLASFDNQLKTQDRNSLTYVCIPEANDARQAWEKLFYRQPRTLEWSEELEKTREGYLNGFDFSFKAKTFRQDLLGADRLKSISIFDLNESSLGLKYSEGQVELNVADFHILQKHLLLKMVLNSHSTLLMGRLGRYQSHFMTYVSPSNGKLVDRATRYVLKLAEQRNRPLDYDFVAESIFRTQREIDVGEPVVLRALESLLA